MSDHQLQGLPIRDIVTAIIPAGQSLSEPIRLGAGKPRALVIPADWTAAGILGLESWNDGNNFTPSDTLLGLWVAGKDVHIAEASAGALLWLSVRTDFDAWWSVMTHIRFQCVDLDTGDPVVQDADRALTILFSVR